MTSDKFSAHGRQLSLKGAGRQRGFKRRGEGEKSTVAMKKIKALEPGFKAPLSAQSRQKAESEPRSFQAQMPDTYISPHQTKGGILNFKLDVNDIVVNYSGEPWVMMH